MLHHTKKVTAQTTESLQKLTTATLDSVDGVMVETTKQVDTYMAPVRNSLLKRYPILFSLLTTFGVAATFLAFEKILTQYQLLNNYPWLILIIGLGTLAFTGTLFKREIKDTLS